MSSNQALSRVAAGGEPEDVGVLVVPPPESQLAEVTISSRVRSDRQRLRSHDDVLSRVDCLFTSRVENVETVPSRSPTTIGDVVIEWDLSINDGRGVVKYRIYRKEDLNADWDRIGTVEKGVTQFTDEGVDLSGNFKYYYHVEAVDEKENWEKSAEMLEITPGPTPQELIVSPTPREDALV